MKSPMGEMFLVMCLYSISIIADLQTSKSLIKGIAQHCIRELINGWEYVRLSDICKITTGKLDANAQVEKIDNIHSLHVQNNHLILIDTLLILKPY